MKKISWKDLEIKVPIPRSVKNTDCLPELNEFIGQERAVEALEMGLAIKAKGYCIFVSGQTNTGRRAFVRQYLNRKVRDTETPGDWLYVYNFDNPRRPNAISMKAGKGKMFQKELEIFVEVIINSITEAFQSEDYQKKISNIQSEHAETKDKLLKELVDKAREKDFTVQINQTGVATIPIWQGKPLAHEIYDALPDEYKDKINKSGEEVRELVNTYLLKLSKSDRDFGEKLKELNKYIAAFAIDGHLKDLKDKYSDNNDTIGFLDRLKADILDNLNLFFTDQVDPITHFKKRYYANLFVDNSQTKGKPVIEEMYVNYSDLFGRIEYVARMGTLETDHSMIRAGALNRSNGGYLILDAKNMLREPYVWDTIKQVLFDEQHAIENLEHKVGIFSTVTLKPESIPVDVKVILIGEPWIYNLLSTMDTDFKKLFKIKAEFDWEMDFSKESVKNLCKLLCTIVKEMGLLTFDRSALEEIVKKTLVLSGSRDKISTKFGEIKQLLVESSVMAEKNERKTVIGNDIKDAWKLIERRGSMYRDKIERAFEDLLLFVDTVGEATGEVNGLTVIQTEDITFGMPIKITAKVSPGNDGIIDIQREAEMSGKIHNKASMIIQGYMNSKYAKNEPLSLNGYVSFEQVYSMVEGDSASVAETVAILSSIAKTPIKQGISVTGSLNQSGRVQPVGGVPNKVEGFYRICKTKGLDGNQGVIIPEANLKNLILSDEVITAIKNKKFHIWTVKEIDEAIEILTGMKPGKENESRDFEKGTFNQLVVEGIKKLSELSKETDFKRKKKA